jgi:hypothetical protein
MGQMLLVMGIAGSAAVAWFACILFGLGCDNRVFVWMGGGFVCDRGVLVLATMALFSVKSGIDQRLSDGGKVA